MIMLPLYELSNQSVCMNNIITAIECRYSFIIPYYVIFSGVPY